MKNQVFGCKKKEILTTVLAAVALIVMLIGIYISHTDYKEYEGTIHYVDPNRAEVVFGFQAGIPEKLYVENKDMVSYAKEHDNEVVVCTIKSTGDKVEKTFKVEDISVKKKN